VLVQHDVTASNPQCERFSQDHDNFFFVSVLDHRNSPSEQCDSVALFQRSLASLVHVILSALLLKYLQLRARFGWSLSDLPALLRQQLFVYRDLWEWIHQPFQPPLLDTLAEQIALFSSSNLDSRTATSTQRP
jgi:hypothetical protein